MNHFFFIGRSERLVLSLLISIAVLALGLYAWGIELAGGKTSAQAQATTQLHTNQASNKGQDSIYKDKHYVGPPEYLRQGAKSNKFREKQVLDLNRVDSLTLIRVPGIGPSFAKRILALRQRLGGYYTVMQLQEVYGMDEDKYLALKSWFKVKTPPTQYRLSELKADELPKHLYLSWEQQRALRKLIYRHGKISQWRQVMKESCFSRDDSIRLSHYFIEDRQTAKQADSLGTNQEARE